MVDTKETYSSKLALFQPPAVETTVEQVQYIEFLPSSTISKGSVIEFRIPGTSAEYIDLSRSKLKVKARIVKSDGNPIKAENQVALVNLSLSSIFRQVDVQMQEKLVGSGTNICYPYKAMLDTLLKYNHDVKEGPLQSELYYKDVGVMDATTAGGNSGLMSRYQYTEAGNEVTLEGPVHTDIFQQERLILNGVKIVVSFHPVDNKFALMNSDSEEYAVSITEAILKVCHVKVSDAVILAQNEALNISPALYPHWKSKLMTISVASGDSTVSNDDIFNGEIPSKLILALVRTEAFTGSYTLNPFNFLHLNANYLEVTVDGQSVPAKPLRPNFETGDYTSSFLSIFFNKYPTHAWNWIPREDYVNGYSLFCFDIQGQVQEDLFAKHKKGHSRLTINFASSVPYPVMLIVYSISPGLIKIGKARNVIVQ